MIDWTGITSASLWTLIGILLILSEFALPGIVAVFFGLAALLVALLLALGLPLDLPWQILLCAVLGAGLLLAARRPLHSWFRGTSETGGDSSEVLPAGTPAIALRDFVRGAGTVGLSGTHWKAESDEPIAAGDQVWLVGRRGLVLRVTRQPPIASSTGAER